jgi:hypothetical protein
MEGGMLDRVMTTLIWMKIKEIKERRENERQIMLNAHIYLQRIERIRVRETDRDTFNTRVTSRNR